MTEVTRTGTVLRNFQSEDVRKIHRQFGGRVLLANVLGSGKSLTCLHYAEKYLSGEPGPTIIVCPAHLKTNWAREVLKHTGRVARVVYHERVPSGTALPEDSNGYVVINYDILVPDGWRSRMPLPDDSWAAWLRKLNPKMIVGDESHALQSSKSKRTKAFRKLIVGVDYVHLLTGTPLTNQPGSMWSLLNILRPDLYPSEHQFLSEFSHLRRYWWGWQARGAKNLDTLHARLSQELMLRRTREEVHGQLPPVTYQTVPLEADLTEYRKAEKDFLGWMRKNCPGRLKGAVKAEQLAKLNHLKQMVGKLKVKSVLGLIDDFLCESDGKLLLGVIHHSVADAVMLALGKTAVLVNGTVSERDKNRAFDTFNDRKSRVRVLVGNEDAAGTGWSCTSSANVDVMEFPWNPSTLVQFCGRVDGIGRGLPGTGALVRFYTIPETIDDDLAQALELKQTWQNTVCDGSANSTELPILQNVLDAMQKRNERN